MEPHQRRRSPPCRRPLNGERCPSAERPHHPPTSPRWPSARLISRKNAWREAVVAARGVLKEALKVGPRPGPPWLCVHSCRTSWSRLCPCRGGRRTSWRRRTPGARRCLPPRALVVCLDPVDTVYTPPWSSLSPEAWARTPAAGRHDHLWPWLLVGAMRPRLPELRMLATNRGGSLLVSYSR